VHGTDAGNATPTIPTIHARTRLDALGEAWLRTPATIGYRTTAPVPGQPESTHQCLRQLVGGAIDRPTALRMCSRQGRLRLTWDPPDRWRMEVTSPLDRFSILSTTEGSVVCSRSEPDDHPCRSVRSREARDASSFGFLLMTPTQILDAIGTDDVSVGPSSEAQVVGRRVECFEATGPRDHVEWCYSDDGLLLSFLGGSAADGWTAIEAVSVSREVADDSLDPLRS
jgi:hypothetical protein